MSKQSPGDRTARTPSTAQLRKLDREIAELLAKRAELTLARGDCATPAEAVEESLQAVAKAPTTPLGDDALRAVFRELHSGIRAAAVQTRVAYLGPEFTYSHLAAIARFGQSVDLTPVATIAAVFDEVAGGDAEFGVVPIENSTDGRVADALHCLARASGEKHAVQICAEVPLRIRHCLLGMGSRASVRRVCSKPQALSQCRNWLAAHLPQAELVPMASTAEAARLALAETDSAAIASEQAGVNHGLTVLARHIEDNPENVTRFAVISRASGEKTGRDKTAIVFEAPHEPGALADAMAIFKRQKLNLTWIESFPLPEARGRYYFFIEFQGHASELHPRRALASLEKRATRLTVLGSYAEADVVG
ncbi:MAG: prephenate dehydratase [Planctomycetaceae bacterium]|nr:prephenate dehydratase [Planctomycetaceae bacterium]